MPHDDDDLNARLDERVLDFTRRVGQTTAREVAIGVLNASGAARTTARGMAYRSLYRLEAVGLLRRLPGDGLYGHPFRYAPTPKAAT